MGVSRLTPFKKTILDVDYETLDPKLFLINLCSDIKFVTTRKYPLEVRVTHRKDNCILDPSGVYY